jgi:hypothetical protein
MGVIKMGRVTAKVREKADYVYLQTRIHYMMVFEMAHGNLKQKKMQQ